jgi:RNA polymerase sigma factor (sigma-70 family)
MRSGASSELYLTEHEVADVRAAVRDRVRRSFRGSLTEADIEDAIQDAWEALLRASRQTQIRDPRAFASDVGWRAARALARRARPIPVDPSDAALVELEDSRVSLVEQIDDRARFARLIEALEQLDDDKREAFELRFVRKLRHEEACELLGITRSAYFKRLRAAKARVEGAMGLDCRLFERRERRLLSDYVAGMLRGRAQMRARRLIAADPRAAALARELRQSHDAAAITLPALGVVAATGSPSGRLVGLFDAMRETASEALGRSPQTGELANAPAIAAGGARGAGAAGAGLLAKALGGLGAGNIALGCIGGGTLATLACVATGVISLPGRGELHDAQREPVPETRIAPPTSAASSLSVVGLVARESARPAVRPAVDDSARGEDPHRGDESKSSDIATRSTSSPVAPTAPAVEQEFGVASAATRVSGAPPDTNDSNGASASTVRGEFGP